MKAALIAVILVSALLFFGCTAQPQKPKHIPTPTEFETPTPTEEVTATPSPTLTVTPTTTPAPTPTPSPATENITAADVFKFSDTLSYTYELQSTGYGSMMKAISGPKERITGQVKGTEVVNGTPSTYLQLKKYSSSTAKFAEIVYDIWINSSGECIKLDAKSFDETGRMTDNGTYAPCPWWTDTRTGMITVQSDQSRERVLTFTPYRTENVTVQAGTFTATEYNGGNYRYNTYWLAANVPVPVKWSISLTGSTARAELVSFTP